MREKFGRQETGGEEGTTPVTTFCPEEAGKYKCEETKTKTRTKRDTYRYEVQMMLWFVEVYQIPLYINQRCMVPTRYRLSSGFSCGVLGFGTLLSWMGLANYAGLVLYHV